MELDRYDRHILEILQQDGRISNQDLADRIGLSPSPCLRRVRALEESGLITGYRALLDARKLGLSLMALIHISMDQHTPERFANFEAQVAENAEVLECLLITGQDADYQLKVVVRDMDAYQDLLLEPHHAHSRRDRRAFELRAAAGGEQDSAAGFRRPVSVAAALRRWCVAAGFDVAEGDAALAQVVGREFQRDLVADQDADVVFLHLSGGVGDEFVTVFQCDPEARVGEDVVDDALHFKQFFFCQVIFLQSVQQVTSQGEPCRVGGERFGSMARQTPGGGRATSQTALCAGEMFSSGCWRFAGRRRRREMGIYAGQNGSVAQVWRNTRANLTRVGRSRQAGRRPVVRWRRSGVR